MSRPSYPNPIAVSVVVPFYNEEEALDALVDQVTLALGERLKWELLLVDDGSVDRTPAIMARRAAQDPRIRPIYLARNYGQTAAMQAGFDHARGAVVVSMDGDLQNDPVDIMRLVDKLDEGFDLVTGYRERRKDKILTRKIPSWIANRLIRWVTGVHIRDTGCSLKAYRRELVQRLHLYSDMHRFIPAMAVTNAGARMCEMPVNHHARAYGQSKYGLSRIWKVLIDLVVIGVIREGREGPLTLFGSIAFPLFLLSAVLGVLSWMSMTDPDLGGVVLPSLTVLVFGLAVHLVLLGLLTETAFHLERRRRRSASPLVKEIGGTDRKRGNS